MEAFLTDLSNQFITLTPLIRCDLEHRFTIVEGVSILAARSASDFRGYRIEALPKLPKLVRRVRFPLPAPLLINKNPRSDPDRGLA